MGASATAGLDCDGGVCGAVSLVFCGSGGGGAGTAGLALDVASVFDTGGGGAV